MSHRQLIEDAYAVLSRRDVDGFVALFTEDAEVYELEELPDADVFRGHDGVRRWVEGGMEHTEEWKWQLEELLHEDGESSLCRVSLKGQGAGSGIPFEMTVFHVAGIREGKIASVRGYLNEPAAREAAGI